MNAIELAKQFVPVLDEVYKNASLTSDLDGAAELARAGANANELIIPMLSMQGLGDYSRNSGYVDGDVTLTNETIKCNFDRGRMFTVDTMDNLETAGIAFGRLAGEFIRTKVVPEIDAFRFACYAGKPGISKAGAASLSTGEAVLKAIRAANDKMDEDEVPQEGPHPDGHDPGPGHHQEPGGAEQLRQAGQGTSDPVLYRHPAEERQAHHHRLRGVCRRQ